MGELKHIFSWSFSSAESFDQCRRKYFWKKYGGWNGWKSSSSEETKKAYLLGKMQNKWSLIGTAAEDAVMWMLREHQAGNKVTCDQAWDFVRPDLTKKWNESSNKEWLQNPKKFFLREHYYEKKVDDNKIKKEIAAAIKNCIKIFKETVLPRLSKLDLSQEISVASKDGDVEHFFYEGVKIYAIPDYAYKIGNQIHIHDWKSGKMKVDQHKLQLSIYTLWAIIKYDAEIENIFLYIEYLKEGKVFPFQIDKVDLEITKNIIEESIGEMSEYLVDFDRDENIPIPKEEWELTSDKNNCRFCSFYELCEKELSA